MYTSTSTLQYQICKDMYSIPYLYFEGIISPIRPKRNQSVRFELHFLYKIDIKYDAVLRKSIPIEPKSFSSWNFTITF